jgi:CheY-like chemotaxis protein
MRARPGHVLVVEDDDDLRESLVELLQLEGFEVSASANGREALERLRAPGRPSAIVLDLMMPVMSGAEFRAEQLRDPALADIPVLLLTAAHDGRRQAEALRVARYFAKPVAVEALLAALREHCGDGARPLWARALTHKRRRKPPRPSRTGRRGISHTPMPPESSQGRGPRIPSGTPRR